MPTDTNPTNDASNAPVKKPGVDAASSAVSDTSSDTPTFTPTSITDRLSDKLQKVADEIDKANNILVALSKNPSVDEISAALALTMILDSLGKHVTAIYSGETPNTLEFLRPNETFEKNTSSLQDFIIALDKEKADHLIYKVEGDYVKVYITPYKTTLTEKDFEFSQGDFNVDLVISLNVSSGELLDAALSEYGRIMHDATAINITTGEAGRFAELEWNEPSKSSVCEMIADLAEKLGYDNYTQPVATALLTGIVAATERFSNARTTSETMALSSKLMQSGADQQLISTNIMQPEPVIPTPVPAPTLAPEPAPIVEPTPEVSEPAPATEPEPITPAEPAAPVIEPAAPVIEPVITERAPAEEPTPEVEEPTPEQQLENLVAAQNQTQELNNPIMEELAAQTPADAPAPIEIVPSEISQTEPQITAPVMTSPFDNPATLAPAAPTEPQIISQGNALPQQPNTGIEDATPDYGALMDQALMEAMGQSQPAPAQPEPMMQTAPTNPAIASAPAVSAQAAEYATIPNIEYGATTPVAQPAPAAPMGPTINTVAPEPVPAPAQPEPMMQTAPVNPAIAAAPTNPAIASAPAVNPDMFELPQAPTPDIDFNAPVMPPAFITPPTEPISVQLMQTQQPVAPAQPEPVAQAAPVNPVAPTAPAAPAQPVPPVEPQQFGITSSAFQIPPQA